MSAFDEASQLKTQLTRLINEAITNHPLVKSAIKVTQCVISSAPDTKNFTIKVRLSPFDTTEIELPYSPKIPIDNLQPNMAASVWYYMDVTNGVVMQNDMWTAYGQDDLENLANGELNLVESIQVLAKTIQQLNATVESQSKSIDTLNTQVQNLTSGLQQTNKTVENLSKTVESQSKSIDTLNTQVQNLTSRVTALENKSS